MHTITITAGEISLSARLNDSPTAQRIWDALPIQGYANIWGDEIYFEIPVDAEEEPGARTEMDVGELAYWPVGSAFCIFFGPTPSSTDEQPRAYSPVNVIGRVLGDSTLFRTVRDGTPVQIARRD